MSPCGTMLSNTVDLIETFCIVNEGIALGDILKGEFNRNILYCK